MSRFQQKGFTIIELMIGMMVGLIATVVMFQVFAISEGQKRTTTGAGDAQQNGVGSVFLIERDARMAGFALNYLPMIGCPVSGWNQTAAKAISFSMAPYVITNGVGTASDSVTIAYGDTRSQGSPLKLGNNLVPATANLKLFYSRYGLQLGDLFIMASTTLVPCTMYQVQARPGTDEIAHGPGGFIDAAGVSRVTNYNNGTGNAIVLPAPSAALQYPAWDLTRRRGTRVINLGQKPTVVTYKLEGNQLVAVDVLNPPDQVVVSDGVVQFQVQYAFDADGDGSVAADAPMNAVLALGADQWADALPANPTPAMWAGIIGIRFAVVSRSSTPERADPVSGLCPTQVPPKWLATDRDLDVSAEANWKCYRYRVFEVTVPSRNLAWAPDENL